jgi:hypothetical protein
MSNNLLLPVSNGSGKQYTVATSIDDIKILPNGTDVIDGKSEYVLITNESITVVDYKSGNWAII